jgi:hypothetical protein
MEWNVIHTMESVEWECGAACRPWFCVFVGLLCKRYKHGKIPDRVYYPLHRRMPCSCRLHNVLMQDAMAMPKHTLITSASSKRTEPPGSHLAINA